MRAAVLALLVLSAATAHAQTLTAEGDVTAGYSTEQIAAAAIQLRAFGDSWNGVRYFAEAAWADRSKDGSDVFGAAYPYGNRVQFAEAYAQRLFKPGGDAVFGVRAGRYRSPFGFSDRSDHAYGGFLRPPLIRYDDYFALSNSFLEHGAQFTAGVARARVDASFGRPADIGEARRRPGLDTIVRGQVYVGDLVAGVSYFRSQPYLPEYFATGHTSFTGVDARWMRDGVQVRGEWIAGRPFDGTTTTGGYVDLMVHRVGMGPVTALGRVEALDYDTIPEFALFARRATAGARIRLPYGLTIQAAGGYQWRQQVQIDRATLDFAVTYSLRRYSARTQ